MSESDLVTYEVRGGVCYLGLNRPDALNALNTKLRDQLANAVRRFESDPDLLVAVIFGSGGRAFSSGADLKEHGTRSLEGTFAWPPPKRGAMVGYDDVEECPKPTIAAIDGYCLGGGLELALCCDVRIATQTSVFGMPEPRWGILGAHGLHLLSRSVPLGEAMKLHLTGSTIDGARAHQIGLVQEVVPDRGSLIATADAMAEAIARNVPDAVRTIKHVVKASRELPLEQAWAFAEPWQQIASRRSAANKGLADFAAHRGRGID